MREIKFRTFYKPTKTMYKVGQVTLEKGLWNYEPDNKEHIGVCVPYQPSFVLMQYTGLHDKNGKEIYEGDIVEVTKECVFERGTIISKDGCYFVKVKETLLPLYKCTTNDFKLKVIGNIYENKELLKEENNRCQKLK